MDEPEVTCGLSEEDIKQLAVRSFGALKCLQDFAELMDEHSLSIVDLSRAFQIFIGDGVRLLNIPIAMTNIAIEDAIDSLPAPPTKPNQ